MKIEAYRYLFQGPEGKKGLGKPKLETELPVKRKAEDQFRTGDYQHFIVHSYDRGDGLNTTAGCYQIAFRVIIEKEEDREVLLSLKWKNEDYSSGNDLQYDKDCDLWYQLTKFDKNGNVLEDKRVDSIKRIGSYRVFATNSTGDILLQLIEVDVQTPSAETVSLEGYRYMLGRLLEIQDRLLRDVDNTFLFEMKSGIRVGQEVKLSDQNGEQWNVDFWSDFYREILGIMQTPTNSLAKEYMLMGTSKIHRFDSYVLREYVKNGSSGKTKAIVYREDPNCYENRVIKVFISKLLRRWKNELYLSEQQDKVRNSIDQAIKADMEDEYNEQYDRLINTEFPAIPRIQADLKEKALSIRRPKDDDRIHFSYDPRSGQYTISTIKRITKRGKTYTYPLYLQEDEDFKFYAVEYRTKNVYEAIGTVIGMCKILSGGFRTFQVQSSTLDILNVQGDLKNLYLLRIANVTNIMNERVDDTRTAPFLIQDYCDELSGLSKRYPFLIIDDRRYEEYNYVALKRKRYANIQRRAEEKERLLMAVHTGENLLCSEWFQRINDTKEITLPPKRTIKFVESTYYARAFHLMNEFVRTHPTIDLFVDEKRFGIVETHLIYEYWVFYELLARLENLGFRIKNKEEGRKELNEHFRNYIEKQTTPKNYTLLLEKNIDELLTEDEDLTERYSLEVLVGYNCELRNRTIPPNTKGDHYTPDYYFRVLHRNPDGTFCYHWYFMDAKYKDYCLDPQSGELLSNDIGKVCIERYIYTMQLHDLIGSYVKDMASKQPNDWNTAYNNVIMGAYLIAANIIDDKNTNSASAITITDRLYGCDEYNNKNIVECILPEECGKGGKYPYILREDAESANLFYKEAIIDGFPQHRFGAIRFNPEDELKRDSCATRIEELQKRDELKTLLQLVFSFMETKDQQEMENHGDRRDKKRPALLFSCWDSSFDHSGGRIKSNCRIEPTNGGKWKFVFECDCGNQRFETHCYECKHGIIKFSDNNFHKRHSSRAGSRNKWDYYCPFCKSSLSDQSEES